MTAGAQAAATMGCPQASISVTLGSPGGGLRGYSSAGGYGAVTPGSVKGSTIQELTNNSASGLQIVLTGTLLQNFFLAVLVQKYDDTWVRFEAASASFASGNTWSWATGNVWATAMPSPRNVSFIW